MPAAGQLLIGGWQVSGILQFASGLPLRVTALNPLGAYGINFQRLNVANRADLELPSRNPDGWFNTPAFAALCGGGHIVMMSI